jgi:hypothetical protein
MIELFQNISLNQKPAFWFMQKFGFKGFEACPSLQPVLTTASDNHSLGFLHHSVHPTT